MKKIFTTAAVIAVSLGSTIVTAAPAAAEVTICDDGKGAINRDVQDWVNCLWWIEEQAPDVDKDCVLAILHFVNNPTTTSPGYILNNC